MALVSDYTPTRRAWLATLLVGLSLTRFAVAAEQPSRSAQLDQVGLDVAIDISAGSFRPLTIVGRTNLPKGTNMFVSIVKIGGGGAGPYSVVVADSGVFRWPIRFQRPELETGAYRVVVGLPAPHLQPPSVTKVLGTDGKNLTGDLLMDCYLGDWRYHSVFTTFTVTVPTGEIVSLKNTTDGVCKPSAGQKVAISTAFKSFDEAMTALRPTGDPFRLLQDPMSLKGQIFAARLIIAQVLDGRRFLLAVDQPGAEDRLFYGYISPSYTGDAEFIDNQDIDVVGEVEGTYQYTTALMSTKTVPKIVLYGVRPSKYGR